MALYAASLNDLGRRVAAEYDGSFTCLVDAAAGSAAGLVEILSAWPCFADRSRYDELELPFLKRAQIAAADLYRAGVLDPPDLARLTMFADNLVPHVLRLDGVLQFDPELIARIDREELIEHGSPEEVEIRACALHAVELIVAAQPADRRATAAEVDQFLWLRGQEPPLQGVAASPLALHGLLNGTGVLAPAEGVRKPTTTLRRSPMPRPASGRSPRRPTGRPAARGAWCR